MLPTKVCCIQDEAEAEMAWRAGARALGLVGRMPSGWGPIPLERIGQIAPTVPPFVDTVLLSMSTDPQEVVAQQRISKCSALQLVGDFPLDGYAHLRQALPGITLLQAVHVVDEGAIAQARALEGRVDGLILDTGSPHAEVQVLGGTGKTHDWSISARVVEAVSTPVFLAGGLKAHNVVRGVQQVRPYGLDLCTGVRDEEMRLDAGKLSAFMQAVAAA